jgi:hypothetical protein
MVCQHKVVSAEHLSIQTAEVEDNLTQIHNITQEPLKLPAIEVFLKKTLLFEIIHLRSFCDQQALHEEKWHQSSKKHKRVDIIGIKLR